MNHDQVIEKLKSKFADHLQEVVMFRDEWTVTLHSKIIVQAVSFLKNDPYLKFNFLVDLTAIDNLAVNKHAANKPDRDKLTADNLPEEEQRFEVVYHMLSFDHNIRLRLKTRVPWPDPKVDSITPVFKSANWYEREVFDMFGIKFEGHPDLRRILNPENFPGHPLRKDFDGKASDEYCPVPLSKEKLNEPYSL